MVKWVKAVYVTVKDFMDRPVRRRSSFKPTCTWLVYWINDDEPSMFALEQLKEVIAEESLVLNAENKSDTLEMRGAFLYIGHGDPHGVFDSVGYSVGLRRHRFQARSLISSKWQLKPTVWWACNSASWLAETGRDDWVGFSNFIGYDLSSGERRWWASALRRMFLIIFRVVDRIRPAADVGATAEQLFDEAVKGHFDQENRSYFTVLFSRAMADSLHIAQRFGG